MSKPEQPAPKAAPKAPSLPPGPVQRCVLCGAPCHAAVVHAQTYEVQDCPDCGRTRRDGAIARRAFI